MRLITPNAAKIKTHKNRKERLKGKSKINLKMETTQIQGGKKKTNLKIKYSVDFTAIN